MTKERVEFISRQLILAWSVWLLASWAVNMSIDGPTTVTSDSMLPVVRWMLQSMALGMYVMWPAWRLSLANAYYGGREVIGDLIGLSLLIQLVVWPMRLLLDWSISQTLFLNLSLIIWAIPIGLWISWGLVWSTTMGWAGKMAAMLLCVATVIAGPLLAIGYGELSLVAWNPIRVISDYTDPANYWVDVSEWVQLGVVGMVAGIGWCSALIWPHSKAESGTSN